MALVEESRISLILDRPEIIILRDADKYPISYEETRETGRMRRALEEYNRSAASLHVCVAGQKIIEGEPLAVGETYTGAATLQAYRMFNESFRFGGRFYGQSTRTFRRNCALPSRSTIAPLTSRIFRRCILSCCTPWLEDICRTIRMTLMVGIGRQSKGRST